MQVKEIFMSLNTERTQSLILDTLPQVFRGSSDDMWQAAEEMRHISDELARSRLIDDEAIGEIASANSTRLGLDALLADTVFDIRQTPGDRSLASMHATPKLIWLGSGMCITTNSEGEVVHYINRPGEVEERYGPGLPYALDKLAWLAVARSRGHEQIYNGDGYSYVTNRLRRWRGINGKPHIGSITIEGDDGQTLLASASGTLPTNFHHKEYDRLMPKLIERAADDEARGLFDGWPENCRAGIYDIAFAEMVGEMLLAQNPNGVILKPFDIPRHFSDVDIN